MERGTSILTWIPVAEHGGMREIALEGLATLSLVKCVHDIGCVSSNVVWVEACTTRLNGFAINSLAADIVDVGLQLSIGGLWFRHTPSFRWAR